MKSKSIATVLLAALVALFSPHLAAGQDVEPEPRKPDSWALVVDLAFSGASGNDRTVLLSSGFQLKHLRTELFEMEWSSAVRYGRSEGREVARNLKSGFKMDIRPAARWSPFVSVTGERDPFRKLDLRSSGGAGVKYVLWKRPSGSTSLSVAGLYSYENFMNTGEVPLDTRQTARWSWRFKGDQRLSERLRIENTTLYQPIWNRSGEYLLSALTALNVPMSERIALTLSHSYDRDSYPPEGVRKDDHLVKAGLTIRTRW